MKNRMKPLLPSCIASGLLLIGTATLAFPKIMSDYPTPHHILNKEIMALDTNNQNQPVKDGIIAAGAQPQLIAKQFAFTEGPAADKEGNVFFTDQPNNRIWKYTTNGALYVFLEPAGRSNGMFFDNAGNLLSCADEQNQIWSISRDGKISVLLKDYKGKNLNGPNDLWADANGGIYFTDPYYQRPYWQRKEAELKGEKVYYLPKGAQQPVVVAEDVVKPNGIVGTPDGKYLYVADIGDNKTYKYQINKDGSLSNRQLFATMGSDGMTLDEKGNVYLTGKGVTVFNKAGEQIEHIAINEPWTANVCFGGANRKKLFITASKAVYTVDMTVKGAY